MNKDFAGLNGFVWWMGVVEDRQDPLKLGRCRVRIVGWHSPSKTDLPTKHLPWSQQMTPINNTNPYAPKEGDMVVGFFIDGESAQNPVMMGVLPGIPLSAANPQQGFNDPRTTTQLKNAPVKPGENPTNYPRVLDEPTTSRLARNDSDSIGKTIVQTKKTNKLGPFELDPTYAAKYPYNNVYESESGHAMEFDDTPKKERVHLYHREGSYIELQADGSGAFKIVKNKNDTIGGNYSLYVQGNMTVEVDGNISFKSKKNISFSADGAFSVKAKTISLNASDSFSAKGMSASLSGTTKTSVGGLTSQQTSVSGLTTKVSGMLVTSITGTTALTMGSTGLTNINGSLINLLGAPVGGDPGLDPEGIDPAGVEIEPIEGFDDGLIDGAIDPLGGVDISVENLADEVSTIGENVSDTLSESLGSIEANLGNVGELDNVNELTNEEFFNLVDADQAASVVENITGKAEEMIANIQDQLSGLSTNISDQLQGSVDNITGPLKANLTVLEGKFDILSDPNASLKDKFAAAQAVFATGSTMLNQAKAIPGQAAAAVSGVVNSGAKGVSDAFTRGIKNTGILDEVKANLSDTYDGYVSAIRESASGLAEDGKENLADSANKVADEWVFQNKDDVIDKVANSALEARQNGSTLDDVKTIIKDGITTSWKNFYADNQAKIAPLASIGIKDNEELINQ